jgi:hypothetical protein
MEAAFILALIGSVFGLAGAALWWGIAVLVSAAVPSGEQSLACAVVGAVALPVMFAVHAILTD